MNSNIKQFFQITLGTLAVAVGIYFFKFPNNFSTGGVSGISIILKAYITSISPGTFVLIINTALLLAGFAFLGKNFGLRTVYCSSLLSVMLWGLERIYPLSAPLTDQPFMELIYSMLLPAVGMAVIFSTGASTGGTDIIAMILRKYISIEIGKALLCTDFIIVIIAGFTFGIKTGMFSFLGLVMKALVIDKVTDSIHLSKYFTIITEKADEICSFINNELHRGATIMQAKGALTGDKKNVILSAMNRSQATTLKKYIRSIDTGAFILVSDTSEVIGRGFRGGI